MSRFTGIATMLVLGGFVLRATGATVLLDDDFHGPTDAVTAGEGRVTGTLAAGWQDNSGWAKVWADYAVIADGDAKRQRIALTRQEDGHLQFVHELPANAADTRYRLTLRARREGAVTCRVGVRMLPQPYAFLWDTTPTLSDAYADQQWVFTVRACESPIALMLVLDGVGTVDVAHVRFEQLRPDDVRGDGRGSR